MNDLTLTVITVNYNNRAGLMRTVASIASQTYHHIQTVIMDGGSSDGSIEYLKIIRLPRLHITSEPDKGIYNAMQKGLSRVDGDAVIFLNSGDSFYSQTTIEDIVRQVDLRNAIVLGRTAQFYDQDVYVRPRLSQLGSLVSYPAHQGVIVPASIAKTVRFSEKHRISADSAWIQQCLKKASCVISPMIISSFELGGVSNSANPGDLLCWISEEAGLRRIIRGGKACIKLSLRVLLGRRWYYRILLSRRCEFERRTISHLSPPPPIA